MDDVTGSSPCPALVHNQYNVKVLSLSIRRLSALDTLVLHRSCRIGVQVAWSFYRKLENGNQRSASDGQVANMGPTGPEIEMT